MLAGHVPPQLAEALQQQDQIAQGQDDTCEGQQVRGRALVLCIQLHTADFIRKNQTLTPSPPKN